MFQKQKTNLQAWQAGGWWDPCTSVGEQHWQPRHCVAAISGCPHPRDPGCWSSTWPGTWDGQAGVAGPSQQTRKWSQQHVSPQPTYMLCKAIFVQDSLTFDKKNVKAVTGQSLLFSGKEASWTQPRTELGRPCFSKLSRGTIKDSCPLNWEDSRSYHSCQTSWCSEGGAK